ncbi:hypothetical protein ILUMI_13557 [Ignelater luminosus]|uniref:Beta-glucuronidase n=1 Tax=Ignelater luminosus TaxID=2038154 RepID=A0A8K0G8J7_IGNLU|nr:hypothetical protein ILUMI_13557 [Ignelater luminosus]
MRFLTTAIWLLIVKKTIQDGILYPKESESREVRLLDGIWNFVLSPPSNPLLGFNEDWYKNDLSKLQNVDVYLMPVPSSYNDVTQNASIRDHVGLVWYDRTFFVPKSWEEKRVWLRFSSVSYSAQVWINGEVAVKHKVGHLPFQQEISSLLNFEKSNRITVACDNRLGLTTVPQGEVETVNTDEGDKIVQSYTFDFFNYAGIHRPVTLYTTPISYIDDITIKTDVNETTGIIYYNIRYVNIESITCDVVLTDKDDNFVTRQTSIYKEGIIEVPNANLWWPFLMHSNPGYLYTLQVELRSSTGDVVDVYRQPIGIRTISWTNQDLLINNRSTYLFGFGRHEDANIRGKGLDLPLIIKDYNLLQWIGANAYRTAHYPYSEEVMDLADKLGVMIIDECPSANANLLSVSLIKNHKNSLLELIQRDKNRPSVIMWSIANEPESDTLISDTYFEEITQFVRHLDGSRPITMSITRSVNMNQVAQHLDVISINRYYSWYNDTGRLDMITGNIIKEATAWYKKYKKVILVSEYGADAIAGLHIHPHSVWTEEYQLAMMLKHFKAYDALRAQKWFIGEFVWNFADFQTRQCKFCFIGTFHST